MNKLAPLAAGWFFTLLLFNASIAVAQDEPTAEEAPLATDDEDEWDEDEGESEGAELEEETPEEAPSIEEYEEPEPEVDCANQIDDDQDGDTDCDDYDCLDHESCYDSGDDVNDPVVAPDLSLDPSEEGEEDEELIEVPDDEDEEEDTSWDDRPVDLFEVHGYLRLRGDIFHQIHIAQVNGGPDNYYERRGVPNYYHPRPIADGLVACDGEELCSNNTFAGANMRFRFEPIINLGDQVRILAQIDLLDNIVLGSTPEGSSFDLATGAGLQSPWTPLRFFSGTQVAPSTRNSFADAIAVRRVWAEVTTPFGQLHFGRMGSHWGMGMLANSGNELDDDWGDTTDRIMLATRLWGILLVPGVDFVATGETLWNDFQGQPIDAAQLDDVTQYFLVIARQLPREEQEERMRRGDLVLNAGLYFTFRNQVLSRHRLGSDLYQDNREDPSEVQDSNPYVHRNAWAVVPDIWFQLYYRGFHLELEFAYVGGNVEDRRVDDTEESLETELRQFGGVVRADFTALNEQLNVGLEFGYASGDAEYEGLSPRQANGIGMTQTPDGNRYGGSNVDSLFRFDPDFNVDLILFEQILGQVSGAYYVRPWVSYEFIRNTLGIRADVLYSLASEPMSTIGNSPHLGVEIDAAIWFRGRPPYNFTAMLQYGVLFPLDAWKDPFYSFFEGVEYPQTVQVLMAVNY